MPWQHVYDPLGWPPGSTLVALLPLAVLLGLLAAAGWPAWQAAVAGLATALVIAVWVVGMPADAATAAALHGAAFGLFPIGWIVVAAMFLYRLSVEAGALGVALTGSDTSSNAMFGSLQRVTAEQLGLDPLLVCTANSTGGVMGKMIDAQSIVVAATATGVHRREGALLRRVLPHSLALAAVVGLLVWLQTGPLAWMVPPH